MGADAFVVFYGIRYEIHDEHEIDAVSENSDPRITAAKQGKLDFYMGRLTDGEPHFLFVGRRLGVFGVQNEMLKVYSAEDLARIAKHTEASIRSVGLSESARFWFQLDAQY